MIGAWMTPCKNGQCKLSVRRDGTNKIVIASQTPLTDSQAEDLFWCVGAMQKIGKTLRDLLKEQETANLYKCPNCGTWVSAENVVHCKDCRFWQSNTQFCPKLSGVCTSHRTPPDWYCADGERRTDDA